MGTSQGHSPRGLRLLQIAAVYLLIGLLMGIGMSMTHNFLLAPVHAHINLLGWASLGLAGLVYCVLPGLEHGWLATTHFWLHNVGLPVMMVGLVALRLGHAAAEPVVAAGALVSFLGLAAFAVNLWKYRSEPAPAAQMQASSI